MLLDVCIPTLNSGKTLKACLDSVQTTIPYKRIVVCDGHSSDTTVKIAKNYGCDVIYSGGRLGEARNRLMREVKTKWFAFVDSDVAINKPWFLGLLRSIDGDTGAVNGFALPNSPLLNSFRKPMLFIKSKFGIRQRGFTSNTLMRKEAVESVTLPDINRCEDIILQHILEERGWRWKMVPAFCRHMKASKRLLVEAKEDLFMISKIQKTSLLGAALKL